MGGLYSVHVENIMILLPSGKLFLWGNL